MILCRRYEAESCSRLCVPYAPSAAVQRAVGICDIISDELRRQGDEAHSNCGGDNEDEIGLTDPNLLSLSHNSDPSLTSSSFNAFRLQTAHMRAKIVGEVSQAPSSQCSTLDQQLSSSLVIASQQNQEETFWDLEGEEDAPFEDLETALRLATRPFPDLKACINQTLYISHAV